jgi:hypothetical protein
MALEWDDRKRLLRMHGIADELLTSARGGMGSTPTQIAMTQQLEAVSQEVHMLLLDTDGLVADEFERVVLQGVQDEAAPDVRAAALVGWLKGGLAGETMEAKQDAEEHQRQQQRPAGRKQSIGFKIRTAITRDRTPKDESAGQEAPGEP